MLNIVVPMAGRGSRFADAGYTTPKPLISIGGKPMIQWVIENIAPDVPHRFIFICQASHLREQPDVPETLKSLCPNCEIIALDGITEGAACTVLSAKEHIDNEDPLMIANSDQFVDCNINEYLRALKDFDGLIMTFRANHPKWSYAKIDSNGFVTEVVEKKVISDLATVGIYNFKTGHQFVAAAEAMIAANFRVNNEFYVAPVYNFAIKDKAKIITYSIPSGENGMFGLGTPEDLESFLSSSTFKQLSSN